MMWGMCTLRCYVCVCVVICCYVVIVLALHTPQRSCTHHYAPHTHHNVHKGMYMCVCTLFCSFSVCGRAFHALALCPVCLDCYAPPGRGKRGDFICV